MQTCIHYFVSCIWYSEVIVIYHKVGRIAVVAMQKLLPVTASVLLNLIDVMSIFVKI
jgi:hypothetical protein